MSTKKIKARKFWGYPAQVKAGDAYVTTKQLRSAQDVRLFILPCTPEAYEQMVEQMTRARYKKGFVTTQDLLAAIGITAPESIKLNTPRRRPERSTKLDVQ